MTRIIKIIFTIILLISNYSIASDKIKILTTIKPIYSILKNTTGNDAILEYVSSAQNSAHDYTIKPSDLVKLKNATIIVIIDRKFDIELWQIIEKLGLSNKTIELSKTPNLTLYKTRNNQIVNDEQDICKHDHKHDAQDHDHYHHTHGEVDYHLWLDTDNVKKMSASFIRKLAELDNDHLKNYEENLSNFYEEIDLLNYEINDELEAVHDNGFIVYHDGYQYFEKKYGLKNLGSIIGNSHASIGLKTVTQLDDFINTHHITCVLTEPYFNSQFIAKLTSKKHFKVMEIDGEWGSNDAPSKDSYFQMMKLLAKNIHICLS